MGLASTLLGLKEGRAKSGRVLARLWARARSQCTTQDVEMSLPVKPITVTTKGCPWRVVLVAQHSPRRAEAVRQRRVTWILCRSPKRRLACAASSSPPRKRRRASGAESWQTHRSQLAMTARGIGMASRRSTLGARMRGRQAPGGSV